MISVLSPSIREGGLDMVAKCLKRQTHDDWEWLASTPYDPPKPARNVGVTPKGDYYYALNRDWNKLYREVKGELIVNIVDLIWFPPDVLEKFWNHYQANKKAIVTAIGHQYDVALNDKPENRVWIDPRARMDQGSFYQVYPNDVEMCLCSIPTKAVKDVGGLDEEYDKGAAISEKEMCYRMDKLEYEFYIDQGIEYRAMHHPRLSKDWDEKYAIACDMYKKHLDEISRGERLKLTYVK